MATKTPPQSRLMSRPETAAYLGVTVRALQDWHNRSYGPRCFPMGIRTVYHRDDVDAWIDAQRAAATRAS